MLAFRSQDDSPATTLSVTHPIWVDFSALYDVTSTTENIAGTVSFASLGEAQVLMKVVTISDSNLSDLFKKTKKLLKIIKLRHFTWKKIILIALCKLKTCTCDLY